MPATAIFQAAIQRLSCLGRALAPPVMRIALALPFLRSGLTRWDPFPSLSAATQYLFEEVFMLHLFGRTYPLPAPGLLAWATAAAELLLPTLLLLGLGTRLAALGLLAMTATIQLVVPDGWVNFHLYWAALALGVIALGPGMLSIDHWIARASVPRGRLSPKGQPTPR
ncbi:DoxX family protein [Pseudoxanthomonas sp.]|uniref:DoxX family protein n=1 Tax=Pseudoxanthomonas sp. TaxID=1871049 RepID=UPI0026139059|nr:DoxX family protein [Pseudoxanthomonas sp.]WDS35810.1 MAG: DoxX family protein [Pseudoxanthomonas sp.]